MNLTYLPVVLDNYQWRLVMGPSPVVDVNYLTSTVAKHRYRIGRGGSSPKGFVGH